MKTALVAVILASFAAIVLAQSSFPTGPQSYGYINVNQKYGVNYFYWLFNSATNRSSDPLILWLTGGPGCSSELALFFENGPWTVGQDGRSVYPNKFGWNQAGNLLYVDQPGGTGFSYVTNSHGYVTNEDQVAEDMYIFLQNFLNKFPQFRSTEFYITGESYAGHYIPAIAHYIWQKNQGSGPKINLKGLAIGNGWTDPLVQSGSYAPFLYYNNKIDYATMTEAQSQYESCVQDIQSGDYSDAFYDCNQVMSICLSDAGNINVYDIRKPCEGSLCYNFDNIVNYINLPATRQRLGVSDRTWSTCNNIVYQYLQNDFEVSYRNKIPDLLTAMPVIFYNGEYDLVCNHYGTSAFLDALQWPGQNGFQTANNHTWTVAGQGAGTVRSYNNLTYIRVFNAGHMVPYDQPQNALDLVTRLVKKQPF